MLQTIDKSCVQTRFLKGLHSYKQHAEVQARMAERLVEHLTRARQGAAYASVLEIGCGSGVLTERFLKSFPVSRYYANDLVADCRELVTGIVRQYQHDDFGFIPGDIESVSELPAHLDLILSNATFQWLENLGEFFGRIKQRLKPGGLLAFSTFGPQNLLEIRELTGNSLTYLPCEELRSLLQEHFEVLTCEEDLVPLAFPAPRQVLRHLRLTGVNGVSRQQWTKSDLRDFEQRYRDRFGDRHRVPLTYHPIFCLVKNA